MQETIDFAAHLADEAGAIIRRYFRQGFDVESKSAEQPVTVADRAVEARLRELIENRYPDDGILGEEYGVKNGRSGRVWVLDPIDGTKSFIIGRPSFGTLIALWEGDNPLLGVIDQPIAGERWVGGCGQTTFNGAPVKARPCPALADAIIGGTDPLVFPPDVALRLRESCRFMVWGGDCYLSGLVANGGLDAVVEAQMQPYDFAALVPVVQNAGGIMSDWEGKPLTLRSGDKTLVAGSQKLQESLFEILKNTTEPVRR